MMFASLADCAHCRVQGAVVETWDSTLGAGANSGPVKIPASSRCRMCEREHVAGREIHPPRRLAQLKDVEDALARWAREEGFDNTREFVESAFVSGSLPAVHAALILGEPVETTFDVLGFLFSHVGGDAPGVHNEPTSAEVKRPAGLVTTAPEARLGVIGERIYEVRNELLALASMAAADGEVVAVERAFLDSYARDRGLALLEPHELRVHRPDEVGPVGSLLDRERVLERMVELAFVDAELDESEVRVARTFARAWGVDPARVDAWLRAWADESRTLFQRLLHRVGRHLFPEA